MSIVVVENTTCTLVQRGVDGFIHRSRFRIREYFETIGVTGESVWERLVVDLCYLPCPGYL